RRPASAKDTAGHPNAAAALGTPAGHPNAAAALGTPAGHPNAAAALGTPAVRRSFSEGGSASGAKAAALTVIISEARGLKGAQWRFMLCDTIMQPNTALPRIRTWAPRC